MRFVLLCVFFCLFGCATQKEKSAGKPLAESPAMQLAKSLPGQEDLAEGLRADFLRRIEMDQQYWRQQLETTLSGAELEAALGEVQFFNDRMIQASENLSSQETLLERMAEFFSKTFSEQELRTLASIVSSPEWRNFQQVMRQLSLVPDALGVRADFAKVIQEEQEKMGARIFGETGAHSSASTGPKTSVSF